MTNKIILSVLASASSLPALAGTASLSLGVGGTIYQTPSWFVNGSASTTAAYTFSAFLGTGTVFSNTNTLYIQNASTLGGDSITLTLPTGCKVGAQSVNAVFIENGNVYSSSGAITTYADFKTGSGAATSMQFSGVTATGTVTGCSSASLAYTY